MLTSTNNSLTSYKTFNNHRLSEVDLINKYKETNLIASCREGNIQAVKKYISEGEEVNARYKNKKVYIGYLSPRRISPLCMAASKGHTEIVEYLVTHLDADVNFLSSDKVSALYGACRNGKCAETVQFLINNGANPKRSRKTFPLMNKSVLEAAKQSGNKEIINIIKASLHDKREQPEDLKRLL